MNSIIAGRCETPRLQEIGGYRHHLDGTTPSGGRGVGCSEGRLARVEGWGGARGGKWGDGCGEEVVGVQSLNMLPG